MYANILDIILYLRYISYGQHFERLLFRRLIIIMFNVVIYLLKAGIMEPEDTAVARQRHGKLLFAAMNTHITHKMQNITA